MISADEATDRDGYLRHRLELEAKAYLPPFLFSLPFILLRRQQSNVGAERRSDFWGAVLLLRPLLEWLPAGVERGSEGGRETG